METKRFSADLKHLPKMLGWIRDHLKSVRLEKGEIQKIELAVEEALVNIINYAYSEGRGKIDLICNHDGGDFTLTIKDWGAPFNPLDNISPINRFVPLEERRVGGLGIAFIYNLMDDVQYQRVQNTNLLTLIRHLSN